MTMNMSTEGMNAQQADQALRHLRCRLHNDKNLTDVELRALNCALSMLGKAIMDAAIKHVVF